MKPLSQNPSNSTPLSEQAIKKKIEEIITTDEYSHGIQLKTVDKMLNLILSDRKAWGEQVMEFAKMKINKYSIHAPRGYPKGTLARRQLLGSLDNWMNKRQRNQGEG